MVDGFIEGIGNILTTVQIVFIILKLANLVTWSWWIVFLPAIASFGLGVLIGTILGIIILLNQKKLKNKE